MKNKRHLNNQTNRTISILLAGAVALCITDTIVLDKLRDTNEYVTNVAESAVKTINKYRDKIMELQVTNKKLERENEELSRALTAYTGVHLELYAKSPPRYFTGTLDEALQDYIWSLCCSYDIAEHYELVYAIIKKESNFNPEAVSTTGDYGLMQINKCNHAWLADTLNLTPVYGDTLESIFISSYNNVLAGIHILAPLLHKYDVSDALMAYNMGVAGARRLWENGIHSTVYSEQVLDYYYQIKKEYI